MISKWKEKISERAQHCKLRFSEMTKTRLKYQTQIRNLNLMALKLNSARIISKWACQNIYLVQWTKPTKANIIFNSLYKHLKETSVNSYLTSIILITLHKNNRKSLVQNNFTIKKVVSALEKKMTKL